MPDVWTYRPNRAGTRQILRETFRPAIDDLAQRIANNVRSQQPDADVVVDSYTTDRSAASVTIRDPRARLWQVRDGILTRAAGTVGLRVRSR